MSSVARADGIPSWQVMNARGRPKSRPCATCPFRVENHDHDQHAKLWSGSVYPNHPEAAMANGAVNECHTKREHACAGAVVVAQRELLRSVDGRPCALTQTGAERTASRMRLDVRRLDSDAVIEAAHPAIADAGIGHATLAMPSPAEREAWTARPTPPKWEPITPRVNPMPADPMSPAQDAKSTPCATCPFRVENYGRVTGQGMEWDTFFTASTRQAVWVGAWDLEHPESALRNGGLNHCHMTHAHACAGALVLQQRELLRCARDGEISDQLDSLSPRGVARVAARLFGSAKPVEWLRERFADVLAYAHPAITDPAIGHDLLKAPTSEELDLWADRDE